jgi:shikimate dehydrogenase
MKQMCAEEIVIVTIEDNNKNFLQQHADAQILVNCTTVGMYPNVDAAPVSLEMFPRVEAVFDLVYNPARTRLMMDAAKRKIPTIGGLTMLVGQAVVSSEIFMGFVVKSEKNILRKLQKKMENLILIGMPGSGKTTYGKILAEKLNRKFIDTDTEIEKLVGYSIPEIFALHGEEFFRRKETEIIAKFGKESGLVIATGGGCVTREENYCHLHQNGIIIFTERNTGQLVREGRPLSQGDLNVLYRKRISMYRRFADIIIKVEGNPIKSAEKIEEEFRKDNL